MSEIRVAEARDPEATERVRRIVPSWCGIEDAVQSSVAQTTTADASWVAMDGGAVVDFLAERESDGLDWDGPTLILVRPLRSA